MGGKKAIIYVDGSNFYFSVKKTFKSKINIRDFCNKLAEKNNLVKIKYYIAPVEQFSNPEMYAEQQSFFEKLRKVPNLEIIFGRLEKRKREGETYYVEKSTDVNLALDLVLDAQANEYEEAFLVSNDGDFSGAVRAAIQRFNREVTYVAIGTNKTISYHLKRVATKTLKITREFITGLTIEEGDKTDINQENQ